MQKNYEMTDWFHSPKFGAYLHIKSFLWIFHHADVISTRQWWFNDFNNFICWWLSCTLCRTRNKSFLMRKLFVLQKILQIEEFCFRFMLIKSMFSFYFFMNTLNAELGIWLQVTLQNRSMCERLRPMTWHEFPSNSPKCLQVILQGHSTRSFRN